MQKLTFEKDWCVTENIDEEFPKEARRRCGTYIVPPLPDYIPDECIIGGDVEEINKRLQNENRQNR